MITEQDLQAAITECEGVRNPTSSTCMKLAAFYTIKDKMYPEDNRFIQQSFASAPLSKYTSNTEFGKLVSTLDVDALLPVIDDLMTALSVLNPRLYEKTMEVVEELNHAH